MTVEQQVEDVARAIHASGGDRETVYRFDDHGHCFVGEVERGAVCMEIGAGDPEIIFIDATAKMFRREGGELRPFPERWFRIADVEWRPVS